MGELMFSIYTQGLKNLDEKQELLRFIFYSYIEMIQNRYRKELINDEFFKEKNLDEERFFNYTVSEKKGKYIYSKESGFGLSFANNYEIRGDVVEYPSIDLAVNDNLPQKVNEAIVTKFKKNIVYMNISLEALDLFDGGFGNLYFNNLETFFKKLRRRSFFINYSFEKKRDFFKFLKNEGVIENNDINLIGNYKFDIRKKIYDYLIQKKIIIRRTQKDIDFIDLSNSLKFYSSLKENKQDLYEFFIKLENSILNQRINIVEKILKKLIERSSKDYTIEKSNDEFDYYFKIKELNLEFKTGKDDEYIYGYFNHKLSHKILDNHEFNNFLKDIVNGNNEIFSFIIEKNKSSFLDAGNVFFYYLQDLSDYFERIYETKGKTFEFLHFVLNSFMNELDNIFSKKGKFGFRGKGVAKDIFLFLKNKEIIKE